VALNLATVLAESGKKTVLLDMDLRRPRIHKVTGLTRSPGLMEVLFDGADLDDVVRRTVAANVRVLTAGEAPPNPSAVTRSKKLAEVIQALRSQYDHVIIDTAPYGLITDAAPLIRLADGVVVTARFGETQAQELNQTFDALERIRANVIGTVLTVYRHKSSTDYHYASNNQYYYNYHDYEQYHEKSNE
jgi:capsular exopolysaccharide synthesis family protein